MMGKTRGRKRGGSWASALCGILGALSVLAVTLGAAAAEAPELSGYRLYCAGEPGGGPWLYSGSAKEAVQEGTRIRCGSLLLVAEAKPEDAAVGELAVFRKETGETAVGKVRANRKVEGILLLEGKREETGGAQDGTQGEAGGEAQDETQGEAGGEAQDGTQGGTSREVKAEGKEPAGAEVAYSAYLGRVERKWPYAGVLLPLYASVAGKVYAGALLACGVMLMALSGKLSRRRRGRRDGSQEA